MVSVFDYERWERAVLALNARMVCVARVADACPSSATRVSVPGG
jgi:hypothetical protein